MNPATRTFALTGLLLALSTGTPALAKQQENPEVERLNERLRALAAAPEHAGLAELERLQAQHAIDALSTARRNEIATALQIAQWRVDTAELALQTATIQREIQALERERSEWLLEASHREAERARQDAERLRMQAQIQAEEAERLRQAVAAEALARQEAEEVLESVASDQAKRAREARRRAAELKAQEEALRKRLEEDDQR